MSCCSGMIGALVENDYCKANLKDDDFVALKTRCLLHISPVSSFLPRFLRLPCSVALRSGKFNFATRYLKQPPLPCEQTVPLTVSRFSTGFSNSLELPDTEAL